MVRLGRLKKEKQKMNFREWVDAYARDGKYKVRMIFPPKNYPSFSLIFEDEDNNVDVKLTIKKDVFKEVMKTLNIRLGKGNLPPLEFVVENGEYGIGISSEEEEYLEWRGNYWIRAKKDDIPF